MGTATVLFGLLAVGAYISVQQVSARTFSLPGDAFPYRGGPRPYRPPRLPPRRPPPRPRPPPVYHRTTPFYHHQTTDSPTHGLCYLKCLAEGGHYYVNEADGINGVGRMIMASQHGSKFHKRHGLLQSHASGDEMISFESNTHIGFYMREERGTPYKLVMDSEETYRGHVDYKLVSTFILHHFGDYVQLESVQCRGFYLTLTRGLHREWTFEMLDARYKSYGEYSKFEIMDIHKVPLSISEHAEGTGRYWCIQVCMDKSQFVSELEGHRIGEPWGPIHTSTGLGTIFEEAKPLYDHHDLQHHHRSREISFESTTNTNLFIREKQGSIYTIVMDSVAHPAFDDANVRKTMTFKMTENHFAQGCATFESLQCPGYYWHYNDNKTMTMVFLPPGDPHDPHFAYRYGDVIRRIQFRLVQARKPHRTTLPPYTPKPTHPPTTPERFTYKKTFPTKYTVTTPGHHTVPAYTEKPGAGGYPRPHAYPPPAKGYPHRTRPPFGYPPRTRPPVGYPPRTRPPYLPYTQPPPVYHTQPPPVYHTQPPPVYHTQPPHSTTRGYKPPPTLPPSSSHNVAYKIQSCVNPKAFIDENVLAFDQYLSTSVNGTPFHRRQGLHGGGAGFVTWESTVNQAQFIREVQSSLYALIMGTLNSEHDFNRRATFKITNGPFPNTFRFESLVCPGYYIYYNDNGTVTMHNYIRHHDTSDKEFQARTSWFLKEVELSFHEHVSVRCDNQHVNITIYSWTLADVLTTTLHAGPDGDDKQCTAVEDHQGHKHFSFPLPECQPEIIEDDHTIAYQYKIETAPFKPGQSGITREHFLGMTARCVFTRTGEVHSSFTGTELLTTYDAEDLGHLVFSMGFFKDKKCSIVLPEDEAVPLDTDIFVRIAMHANVEWHMYVTDCTAMPTATSAFTYKLIDDGCFNPNDETLEEVAVHNPTSEYAFTFDAFKFKGVKEAKVFMKCEVIVCKEGDPDTQCHKPKYCDSGHFGHVNPHSHTAATIHPAYRRGKRDAEPKRKFSFLHGPITIAAGHVKTQANVNA